MRRQTSVSLVILVPALALLGCCCGHFWPAHDESLAGPYRLCAPMDRESMGVWLRDDSGLRQRIPATVFAVGWNDQFILAKQHPRGQGLVQPDTSVTDWYILRIADDKFWGGMTESEFAAKRDELGVPSNLGFTRVFKDLE